MHLCPYCAFSKTLWNADLEREYLNALKEEIKFYTQAYELPQISTLFLGGGTPSSLSEQGLDTLLNLLTQSFQWIDEPEKTSEMNPETITPEKLAIYKHYGFNRVSLGVQSFNNSELEYLGRQHKKEVIYQAIDHLKNAQFKNINFDFMFGFKGSTEKKVIDSLIQALELNPSHLSTYALSIEPGTDYFKNKVKKVTTEQELYLYKCVKAFLEENGFCHYEVSAFSKPGFECKHNRAYWTLSPFIGIGPSASSFFQTTHYKNTSDVKHYIQNPLPPIATQTLAPLSQDDMMKDFLVAQLRLLEGIHKVDFEQRFGVSFIDRYKSPLKNLIEAHFLQETDTHIKVTTQGLFVLDSVLEALL